MKKSQSKKVLPKPSQSQKSIASFFSQQPPKEKKPHPIIQIQETIELSDDDFVIIPKKTVGPSNSKEVKKFKQTNQIRPEKRKRNAGGAVAEAINALTKGKHHKDEQQRVPDRNTSSPSPIKNVLAVVQLNSVAETPEKKVVSPENSTGFLNMQKIHSADKRSPMKLTPNISSIGSKDSTDNVQICEDDFLDLSDQMVPDVKGVFDLDWDVGLSPIKLSTGHLNLKSWQRCKVTSVNRNSKFDIFIKAASADGTAEAECILKDNWRQLNIIEGDIVSMIAMDLDENGAYVIDSKGGFVVQYPDTLVSGTSVVGSLFCKRKSVLQEHFRGIDCNNKIMTIGSLTHELLQRALAKNLTRESEIRAECESMLKEIDTVYMLYGADLSYGEGKMEMLKFVPQIVDFISRYVHKGNDSNGSFMPSPGSKFGCKKPSEEWTGRIDNIVDIEENIWSPHLGLKGKIDVTCEVTIHNNSGKSRKLLPLELKTGKASLSAEHRGQVILYTMMMSNLNNQRSGKADDVFSRDITEGLLLYLRDKISIREIKAGHPEKRDLIMLRNELAYYLVKNFKGNVSQISSNELSNNIPTDRKRDFLAVMDDLKLPEPINHHSACGNCAYLTLCSLYLSRDKDVDLNSRHPLKKLEETAVGHLSEVHKTYFIRWVNLLAVEESDRRESQIKDIWTVSPSERESKGKCLSNLSLQGGATSSNGRFLHRFLRSCDSPSSKNTQLQVGDYVVVSSRQEYAISSGSIESINDTIVSVLLERNIQARRKVENRLYHIDAPPSSSGLVFNLTNLGLLMDSTIKSVMLRRMIIDREKPTFVTKLPRRVADLGKELLSKLNSSQQRAVLRAITANEYLLIRGMPGTGKSQTCACLIELLVKLGQSVLITSHTHSAVDNLMQRLIDKDIKMLRLGSSSRVHPLLKPFTEAHLTESCETPDDLNKLFLEANVVGVTCLGSGHTMLSKRQFDVCLVDESTQVLQCCILRPLFAAKKFILVGDPDQLPPIVRSDMARSAGMEESLFIHLGANEDNCISLSCQYRMNRPITELANRLTYDHKLTCANEEVANGCLQSKNIELLEKTYSTQEWLLKCLSPNQDFSVLFLDTGSTYDTCLKVDSSAMKINLKHFENSADSKKKGDCSNIAEALVVLKIVQEFHECGISSGKVGIITPYRDQVALLKSMLHNFAQQNNTQIVEVNTVDQFQGRDKDVIIYSCSKTWDRSSSNKHQARDTEILQDHRRLTVAITRAKHKLIMIGDILTLTSYKPFKLLLESLQVQRTNSFNFHKDCIVSLPEIKKSGIFIYENIFNSVK